MENIVQILLAMENVEMHIKFEVLCVTYIHKHMHKMRRCLIEVTHLSVLFF